MSKADPEREEPRHGIGVVSRRTGVSQLVLRAWERRYAVVAPGRTGTGRRLYSDLDVERLTLLRILTDHGFRIGDVVSQPLAELRELAAEATAEGGQRTKGKAATVPASPQHLLAEALGAVQNLDPHRLQAVLERASVGLSIPALRRELIQPLMVAIGERWRQGTLRVAQEHMATAIVRSFLSSLNARQTVAPGCPLLAIAAPSGDLHEMGALLAASHALEVGWDVLYLGPNLPAEEMAAGVQARQARALYISLIYPPADPAVGEQLLRIRRLVGENFPLIVGGRAAAGYQDLLARIRAVWAPDPAAFDCALNSILSP